ncbi:MAG: hypothetical protein HY761_02940 [Candidatus Omnitrophica bacterium]|nr:hypothetical protein [Candidatus Omnitrophota bacterium]
MDKIIRKLIFKKLAVRCELSQFDYANYFANYFLSIFIIPKHLKLFAGGMPSGGFVNNPLEGYRTLVPIKTTQNPLTQKPLRQGGANKGEA